MNNTLITGGCGFIGSNFIRYLFSRPDFRGRLVNIDKLTYAGNPENLSGIGAGASDRHTFIRADVCDRDVLTDVFRRFNIKTVIHFAAESHVDRSIHGPDEFIRTNILGTFSLLETARDFWKGDADVRFHHVSTDEVYGSLGPSGHFYESTAYDPRSPYSASKAASDHLVRAYYHTYGLPVSLTNCSNNYGPYQFPEKLIPLMILNALSGKQLPVYGDGLNARDWLHVNDHCAAIWQVIREGNPGETYNVGGESEIRNLDVVEKICAALQEICPPGSESAPAGISSYHDLVTFVTDRPGHDRRYAMNIDKISTDLKWRPAVSFQEGLDQTIRWYISNRDWVERITSGEYRNWIEKNYRERS